MAQCTNAGWTINLSRDPSATMLQTLFFDLKINEAGDINGNVFIAGVPEPISQVTGTCRPIDNPDGTLMTLSFIWGAVDMFMFGFTHFVDPFTRFEGRFIATARPDDAPLNITEPLAALAAGPGDTGTGTGQQT
jgi:hypothetical protein